MDPLFAIFSMCRCFFLQSSQKTYQPVYEKKINLEWPNRILQEEKFVTEIAKSRIVQLAFEFLKNYWIEHKYTGPKHTQSFQNLSHSLNLCQIR